MLLTLGLAFLMLQVLGLAFVFAVFQREGVVPGTLTPQQLARVVAQPYVIIGSALISGGLLLLTAGVAAAVPGVDLRLRAWRLSALRALAIVIGGGAAAVFLSTLVDMLAAHSPALGVLQLMERALRGVSGGTCAAALVTIGLLSPVAEELFFRGLVQTRLTARWGALIGILVSSAAFGLFHGDLIQAPFAFGLGLYLGWTTEVSRSVVPAIVVHVLNNCASVVGMSYGQSGSQGSRLLILAICGAAVAAIVDAVGRRVREERWESEGEPPSPVALTSPGARTSAPPPMPLFAREIDARRLPASPAPSKAPDASLPPPPPVRVPSSEIERRRLQMSSIGAPRPMLKAPRIAMTTPAEVNPAAELRFVVRRIELMAQGLHITGQRGSVHEVPWAGTEALVVRRLPADEPWNGQLLVDIVAQSGGTREVVRVVGTTAIAFGRSPGRTSGVRLENVRGLAAQLAAQNPNLAMDPETAAFAQSDAPAGRFVSMTEFTEYDARYG